MSELETLQKEIDQIKELNRRVEANKAWETSTTRKVLIAVLTYVFMVLTFTTLQSPTPWKDAIIPTLGFLLSTFSLTYFRVIWEKSRNTKP